MSSPPKSASRPSDAALSVPRRRRRAGLGGGPPGREGLCAQTDFFSPSIDGRGSERLCLKKFPGGVERINFPALGGRAKSSTSLGGVGWKGGYQTILLSIIRRQK